MTHAELFDKDFLMNLPVSFRVFGVGEDTAELIETVKSFGYECVSAEVITNPHDCIPTDEDKMVIIVAKGNEGIANSIAKTFHDTGVLTLGMLDNADLECYDSVVSAASFTEYPDAIKTILQPIVTQGMINYDFRDLHTTLSDTKHFFTKSVAGQGSERVAEAVALIKGAITQTMLDTIERLSVFMYFNREGEQPLVMKEVSALNDFLSSLPETVEVIWAVYHDESVKDHEVKVSIIASGKNLIVA